MEIEQEKEKSIEDESIASESEELVEKTEIKKSISNFYEFFEIQILKPNVQIQAMMKSKKPRSRRKLVSFI